MGIHDLSLPSPLTSPGEREADGPLSGAATALYLLGGGIIAALGATPPSGPASDALVVAAWLAAVPWLLVMSTEMLMVLTVLALPFDSWKIWSAISATNVLISIATARFLLDLARGARAPRPSFAYRPLLAVAIAVVASTAFASDRGAAARLLVSVFGAGAFAVLLVNYCYTPRQRERVLDALFAAGLLMGAAGLVQFAAYQLGWELWTISGPYYVFILQINQIKVTGLSISSGGLAAYIVPVIGCGVFLWGRPKPRVRRAIMRTATMVCIVAAVLTITRATLLTLVLLGAVIVVTRVARRVRRPWVAAFVAAAMLSLGALLVLPRVLTFLGGMNPASTASRLSIFSGSLNSFRAHPIIGIGLGGQVQQSFANADIYDLAESIGSRDLQMGFDPRDTHSTPMEIAVDMGMAGVVAFGWLFAATFRRAVRSLGASGERSRSITTAVFAAWLATLLVLCFNDGVAMKPLWMLLGLLWILAP